ncbi:MAG TPA: hypothetical protein VHA70_09380 [Bauldia sp.]|nr:hypothetical protein [Bauldia sp.]
MTSIPCARDEALTHQIEEMAEVLKTQAHKLGTHGLDEADFYNSGLFRGAIERIRGQFSASISDKKVFVQHVLNHLEDQHLVRAWEHTESANRNDYRVTMEGGRVAVIDLKGCLDGNNTTIFERPQDANEFVVWSICTNLGADPQRNAWSGINTRLAAEVLSRRQNVDGLIIWDMFCGTVGRPCPKISADRGRKTTLGPFNVPPPCIYLFPSVPNGDIASGTLVAQPLDQVKLLNAFHTAFCGAPSEINFVDFDISYRNSERYLQTTIRRGGRVAMQSSARKSRRA